MPQQAIATRSVSAICGQPGCVTMSERAKMVKDMKVMGRHSFSDSHMVRMKEASAIRAETAAVSEVGGDNSPQTASRNAKKFATQGSMPSLRMGSTMMTARMM